MKSPETPERLAVLEQFAPLASQTATVGGLRMHYWTGGSGKPVILVHGNPTWSFYYRRLARDLARSHQVFVPDHIGCGLSARPTRDEYPYDLARRVADLEELIDTVTKGPVTLILHDWGGMIGMGWAVANPERVERIVALNTACFRLPRGKMFPFPLRLARLPVLGDILVRGCNLFVRGALWWACTKPLAPEIRAGYLLPYDSWKNRRAILEFVRDIPLGPRDRSWDTVTRVEDQLAVLRSKPLLILWGERDFVFDRHFLSEWRQRFPEARIHTFDAGHLVLEDAAEELIPLISSFLAEKP